MNAQQESDSSRRLLLGEGESRYGEYRLEELPSGKVACSLSVGSDPDSPALAYKGHPDVPNEDGLLVVEQDDRVLLAVADAHFGSFASHALLRHLDEVIDDVPVSPAVLLRALREVGLAEPGAAQRSVTALLLVVLRRDMQAGFGFSFGDCTCAAVGGTQQGTALNEHNDRYVSPGTLPSIAAERASLFEFEVSPGSLLLAFTDGIDGCHYGQARSSLGPPEYVALFEEIGADVETYARRLTEAAIRGLPGHPGGQDNIALVVAAA